MKTTLVIMAAGMGSRFGSLKQMQSVDENGRGLLEYSVYDAKAAGFDEVVFIIRKCFAEEFISTVGAACEKILPCKYVYQELDSCLPEDFALPAERQKPWGTGHAVLCAAEAVQNPFGVINADDYYGRSSFELLHAHLVCSDCTCMIAFRLANTLSENGTVSRGICVVKDGLLSAITEHTALDHTSPFAADTPVSMNMWGFMPSFFEELKGGFAPFLHSLEDPTRGEYFLPGVVDATLKAGAQVAVHTSAEKWYGITYREDLDELKNALAQKHAEGLYDRL